MHTGMFQLPWVCSQAVFRIRISLNADPNPDPGFYLNADPDLDSKFLKNRNKLKILKFLSNCLEFFPLQIDKTKVSIPNLDLLKSFKIG